MSTASTLSTLSERFERSASIIARAVERSPYAKKQRAHAALVAVVIEQRRAQGERRAALLSSLSTAEEHRPAPRELALSGGQGPHAPPARRKAEPLRLET